MIAHKIRGSIVHISSQASRMPLLQHVGYCGWNKCSPITIDLGASKAALDQVCRTMTVELGPHGIRVNCVNPTVVLTDMGRQNWSEPTKVAAMMTRIPLHRFAGTYIHNNCDEQSLQRSKMWRMQRRIC
jgi:L-xylulose reductase